MTHELVPIHSRPIASVVAAGRLAVCPSLATFAEPLEASEGFRVLFNGENLAGWYGDRVAAVVEQQAAFHEHWKVVEGEPVNDGQGPCAATYEEFGNIYLWLEYKTVAGVDGGVYLRGEPQVQIRDNHGSGRQ